VIGVIAFHLGYLSGGWLGVDCFFVLSGYLITTLLLDEERRAGRIDLLAFWARRARRLLPAVLLLALFVGGYSWLGGPGVTGAQLRKPLLSTLFYAANWQQISSGHGYFAQFQAPSPLTHTWSLAIEEQYYLLWPPLLAAVLVLVHHSRQKLLVVIGGLATASAVWMAAAARVLGVNRAYLGTDTRAWELLIGALAAILCKPDAPVRRPWLWSLVGAVGVIGVGLGGAWAGGPPHWIFDGGLVGIGLCLVAAMVCSVRVPHCLLGRALSIAPLRWLGQISYSLYLWHWPVIVLITAETTGLSKAALLVIRLVAMLAASCASYYLVERPLREADWSSWRRRALVPAVISATTVIAVAGTVTATQAASAPITLRTSTFTNSPSAPAPAVAPAQPSAAPATTTAAAAPTTTTTTVPLAVLAGRTPSPSDPLRVWIVGDSVMHDSSLGLSAALEATHDARVVLDTSFGGWGLARDPAWPRDWLSYVQQDRPEIIIATWSWDTELAAADPTSYRQRLAAALTTVMSPAYGIKLVVLLQFPTTGPLPTTAGPDKAAQVWARSLEAQASWDTAAQAMSTSMPGRVVYLRDGDLFAPQATFLAWHQTLTGSWIRARKIDNAHLCPYGAAEFGALVVGDLTPALGLAAATPGWESGRWVHDHRYNDPPGACPADQPPAHYTGTPLPVPLSASP